MPLLGKYENYDSIFRRDLFHEDKVILSNVKKGDKSNLKETLSTRSVSNNNKNKKNKKNASKKALLPKAKSLDGNEKKLKKLKPGSGILFNESANNEIKTECINKKVTERKEKINIPYSGKQNVKQKTKKRPSSDRLFALSLPKRNTILQNYQYYRNILPPKSLEKFKEILNAYTGDFHNDSASYGIIQ